MSAEDVRAFVDRSAKAWNGHDRAGYAGMYSDETVIGAPGGVRLQGRAGIEGFFDMWQGAFPDTMVEIRTVIADESSCCVEALFHGTQTGVLQTPMGEIQPTGRTVAIPFAHLFTLNSSGTVDRSTLYFDTAEIVAQLGLTPAPATA